MKIKTKRKPYILYYVVIVIAIATITIFMLFYTYNKINKAIYEERKASLTQLINISANSVNDGFEMQWEISNVYENDVKSHVTSFDHVEDYLAYLNTQISNENDYYFLVDSVGKYYCSDGNNGKIINTDYFLDDTADKLEYLGNLPHFNNDITYLILRKRLDTPIKTSSKNGEITIMYCCLMHDVSLLNESINSLYNGQNNTMIFDTQTGVMMYKQFGISLLIDGYNIYDKYQKVELSYGVDVNQVIDDIKNKQVSVSMMELKGEDYYLCSSPLNVANWSLYLVVASSYFDNASSVAFAEIIKTTIGIILFASLVSLLLIWYFNRLKINKKILDNEYKVNNALQDAYKTKSDFLSYMSHDIRTPINGIIGMSNIGIANSSDKNKVEECFKKIDLSSKHLLAIVNDVLDMSALESGKIVIKQEKMNIITTLKECLDIIKGSLNDRQLNIIEEYDCANQIVLGDEFHLKQIIINILSNAVKFTNDDGTIKLSLKQLENSNYEIKITDNGIGMSEEFQKHIFEAFKQANPNGRTNYKGTGLGMAISSEYVKLMHGSIKVESKENVGSTFIVSLPFDKVNELQKNISLEELNILLVEDNEINMEIAKTMLADKIKKLDVAKDGQQAIDCYLNSEEFTYDLILMDVMMPVKNGLEATKEIRSSHRKDNNLPIIALTANTYKDDIDAIFSSGMNDYLNKPFSIEQLLEKIRG